jgi:hypothetical protein
MRCALVGQRCLPLLLAGCGTRGYTALLALEDQAADGGSSRLNLMTPAPRRQLVRYHVDGRKYQGDLHMPGEPALCKILLVPGIGPLALVATR